MRLARRYLLASLCAGCALRAGQFQDGPPDQNPAPPPPDRDKDNNPRLPNGKNRNDAIADAEHKRALEEVNELISMAQKLKGELSDAGRFVVPLSAVRRTEEIEKLARRIRGRLRS